MQIGVDHLRRPRSGDRPRNRCRSALSVVGLRRRCRFRRLALDPDDLVDLAAGSRVIPPVQLADQDNTDTGTALVAVVASGPVPVIEPVAVPPAAERAGSVLV